MNKARGCVLVPLGLMERRVHCEVVPTTEGFTSVYPYRLEGTFGCVCVIYVGRHASYIALSSPSLLYTSSIPRYVVYLVIGSTRKLKSFLYIQIKR